MTRLGAGLRALAIGTLIWGPASPSWSQAEARISSAEEAYRLAGAAFLQRKALWEAVPEDRLDLDGDAVRELNLALDLGEKVRLGAAGRSRAAYREDVIRAARLLRVAEGQALAVYLREAPPAPPQTAGASPSIASGRGRAEGVLRAGARTLSPRALAEDAAPAGPGAGRPRPASAAPVPTLRTMTPPAPGMGLEAIFPADPQPAAVDHLLRVAEIHKIHPELPGDPKVRTYAQVVLEGAGGRIKYSDVYMLRALVNGDFAYGEDYTRRYLEPGWRGALERGASGLAASLDVLGASPVVDAVLGFIPGSELTLAVMQPEATTASLALAGGVEGVGLIPGCKVPGVKRACKAGAEAVGGVVRKIAGQADELAGAALRQAADPAVWRANLRTVVSELSQRGYRSSEVAKLLQSYNAKFPEEMKRAAADPARLRRLAADIVNFGPDLPAVEGRLGRVVQANPARRGWQPPHAGPPQAGGRVLYRGMSWEEYEKWLAHRGFPGDEQAMGKMPMKFASHDPVKAAEYARHQARVGVPGVVLEFPMSSRVVRQTGGAASEMEVILVDIPSFRVVQFRGIDYSKFKN